MKGFTGREWMVLMLEAVLVLLLIFGYKSISAEKIAAWSEEADSSVNEWTKKMKGGKEQEQQEEELQEKNGRCQRLMRCNLRSSMEVHLFRVQNKQGMESGC